MKMYKSIVFLLLAATVYTEIINQLACSPGFVQINTYCVQSDTNTVGSTASNDRCTSFDDDGLCITQINTNAQVPTNEALTSTPPSANSNTFPQAFVPNVVSSSPQNNASNLNPLFTLFGAQSPQFSSQSVSTTASFPSSLAAPTANSRNAPTPSLISSENPTFQTGSSSIQNSQIASPPSITQNIPAIVKSASSQTNTQQAPSSSSTKSQTLTPQLSQLLFRGGNPPSTSSTTSINTNPSSRTSSPTQNTQTTNANRNSLGISSLNSTQSRNAPSGMSSNSVSNSSSSVSKDINPFSYCARFNPTTLICEQCAKGYRVNPKFNKTNPDQEPYCLALDPLCKTYSNDSSRCASCYTGYDILNSTCVVSRSTLANCQTANANRTACTKCYKGFYVDPTTRQCKSRNPQCATYTTNTSNECATCYAGYRVVKGDCVIIPNTVVNISNTSNDTNTKESSNPIFFGSPSIFYFQAPPLLVTTNLDAPPAAPTVSDTLDLNCAKFANGVCVQCNLRAYFKGKLCQPVSDQCQKFNQNTGSCTSCFKGFELKSNGTCVKGNDLCMTRNASTGLCTACYLGYKLSADGKCQ